MNLLSPAEARRLNMQAKIKTLSKKKLQQLSDPQKITEAANLI